MPVHNLAPLSLAGSVPQDSSVFPQVDMAAEDTSPATQRGPQGAIDPPTFTLFANREIPSPYLRYIERTIREEFGLGSTAMKIRVRKKS